ncbi:unnamed protein product, partial [Ceratitis capitata]
MPLLQVSSIELETIWTIKSPLFWSDKIAVTEYVTKQIYVFPWKWWVTLLVP